MRPLIRAQPSPAPNLAARPLACSECGGRLEADPARAEWACRECGLVEDAALTMSASPLDASLPGSQRPSLAIPRAALPGRRLGGQPSFRRRAPDRVPQGIARARRELNRLADALAIPPGVALEAFLRYQKLHEAGKTQGRRLMATAAACLLDAARDRGVPRTAREVAAAAQVRPADIGRALRKLAEHRGQRILPSQPERFLWALASRAELPPNVVAPAARTLARMPATSRAGHRPEPLAAAALVHACRRLDVDHNLARLAREAGVSRQAVHQAVRRLDSDKRASTHMNDFLQVTDEGEENGVQSTRKPVQRL